MLCFLLYCVGAVCIVTRLAVCPPMGMRLEGRFPALGGGGIFLRKARPKKHASDSDVSEA